MEFNVKKQIVVLALVAGIATQAGAMDADKESSLLNWKTGAAVAAGACVLYVAYNWLTDSKPVTQFPVATFEVKGKTAKQPVIFAQPPNERVTVQREQQDYQSSDESEVGEEEEEVVGTLQDAVVRFKAACDTNQKIEIMNQVRVYVESPSQQLEDLITQYANVYCQRVKTSHISTLTNKLFAAKSKQARQQAAQAIQQKLGLLYY